jgi:hypothetical protein
MILDYIACGYVLYRIGVPLILSLPNPRKFEEKRIRRLRQHDIWVHARRAVLDFLLVGAAFLVAWRHADLGILWLALGIAFVGLAVPTAFAWGISRIAELPDFPAPEVSEQQLERLTRKRRLGWAILVPLILVWCYSWRTLAV